jgi:primosomal replication protein N
VEPNAVSLSGTLAELEPLRHTPAGLPLVNFKLAHRSMQIEAGFKRQVECDVMCVAVGDAATQLSTVKQGAQVVVTGFLNRRYRASAQLVLHATQTVRLDPPVHEPS